MKNLLLLAILCLISHVGTSQKIEKVRFKKKKALPVRLFGMAYTTDGQRILVVGGGSSNPDYTNGLFMYNPMLDEWLDLSSSAHIPPFRYGQAVYLEEYGSMALLGGTTPYGTDVGLVADITTYDLKSYRPRVLGPNPTPSRRPGVAYWKKKLYFFGGSVSVDMQMSRKATGKYSRKMYEYDLSTGVIQSLPDLPEAKETDGGIVDGRLYVFGGYDNQGSRAIHAYDTEDATWQKIGALDDPVSAYALAQYQHFFLLVGDYEKPNQLIVFDARTNTHKAFKLNFRGRHMGAVVLDETLHVFGGFDPRRGALRQHWTLNVPRLLKKYFDYERQ